MNKYKNDISEALDYVKLWMQEKFCDYNLIAVPPQNTSRCCPACGHTTKDNRQTQALFECVDCGYQNNADVVGAINVLNRGQEILAAQ